MPREQLEGRVKADVVATVRVLVRYPDFQLREATRRKAVELLTRYPNDIANITDMLLFLTCAAIRDSTAITDEEKSTKWGTILPNIILVQSPGLNEILGLASPGATPGSATNLPNILPRVGAPANITAPAEGGGGPIRGIPGIPSRSR
jgi:hypothetical protein